MKWLMVDGWMPGRRLVPQKASIDECYTFTGVSGMRYTGKRVFLFLLFIMTALFPAFVSPAGAETVVRSIGTLPPGKSITVTFDVTVNDPFIGMTPAITNQALITGSNFSPVLSDDPSAPGTNDPTVTRIFFLPAVSITSDTTWVTYDAMSYSVSGTNNIAVAGMLSWSNSLNGSHGTTGPFIPGTFAAWSIAVIPLDVGNNIITVSSSNFWNDTSTDTIIITRGGIGTGTPQLAVTSDVISVVYSVTAVSVSGTNNMHVAGNIDWAHTEAATSGIVNRTSGSNAWSAAVTVLEGNNTVSVRGTNALGIAAQDSVVIIRQSVTEAAPQIATNALVFPGQDSVLSVIAPTNITWLVEGITDDIDGTNLTITMISVHVSNTLVEVSRVTNDIANTAGSLSWIIPPNLVPVQSTLVIRFEVVDSTTLTNSRIFYDNPFTVIPEPGSVIFNFILVSFMIYLRCKRQQ